MEDPLWACTVSQIQEQMFMRELWLNKGSTDCSERVIQAPGGVFVHQINGNIGYPHDWEKESDYSL